jgi:hypothetical protein
VCGPLVALSGYPSDSAVARKQPAAVAWSRSSISSFEFIDENGGAPVAAIAKLGWRDNDLDRGVRPKTVALRRMLFGVPMANPAPDLG